MKHLLATASRSPSTSHERNDSRTMAYARVCVFFLAAIAQLSMASQVFAQTYPDHALRLIVPLPPGGAVDVAARLLQPYLEKSLGQPVIIENKPGASGVLGADAVAKAAPDGLTLLMVPSTFTVNPAVIKTLPYDTVKDFAPIVTVAENSLLFLVNPKVPAKTLQEFVALAKANPGKFNYATPGATSEAHLLMEMWSAQAGIKMQQIPYRGGAPAVMATVAGQTQITLMSPLAALSQIKAGNLRPLATGNTTRDKLFPDIPTMGEVGYPSVVAVQWIGLLTTGGTPQPIIERLNAVTNDALKDPALVKKLGDQGVTAVGGTSQQFKKVIATELNNWKAPAKRANIVAE